MPCVMPYTGAGLAPGFVVSFQTQSLLSDNFQANIGQKEDFEAARKKAQALGAKKVTASLPPGSELPLLPAVGLGPGVSHTPHLGPLWGGTVPLRNPFYTKAF